MNALVTESRGAPAAPTSPAFRAREAMPAVRQSAPAQRAAAPSIA